MSITDELRKWAHERFVGLLSSEWEREVDGIADRIDEQHRKALAAMVEEPDETERRIKALEHLADGMLLDESELRERIEKVERKLNHKKVDE